MSASVNDKFTDVRNSARPNTATVSTLRVPSASNLACDSLVGWPTASKVHFVTYQTDTNNNPIAGTQLDCVGIVSANTITNLAVIDGTDGGNSVGDIVEMLPTAAWARDLADGLMISHNRDGTLADGAVDSADVLSANVVTTTKILDDAVTAAKLADSAVVTANIVDDAVTSDKVYLSVTTDANSWKVYDYGSFKQYTYSLTNASFNINSGQRTTMGTIPLPSGKTSSNVLLISMVWVGGYAGHALVGAETPTGSGWQVNVGNQYAGGALTFSGKVNVIAIDI